MVTWNKNAPPLIKHAGSPICLTSFPHSAETCGYSQPGLAVQPCNCMHVDPSGIKVSISSTASDCRSTGERPAGNPARPIDKWLRREMLKYRLLLLWEIPSALFQLAWSMIRDAFRPLGQLQLEQQHSDREAELLAALSDQSEELRRLLVSTTEARNYHVNCAGVIDKQQTGIVADLIELFELQHGAGAA